MVYLSKITKYKPKQKKHYALANAPVDKKILCRECNSPVKASSVKEITDMEILITYECMCGLVTKRLYRKAPDNHEDCKESEND